DRNRLVTSIMLRSKAYDRTTPPTTPRICNHSQTSRPLPGFQAPRYRIDPRDALPAIWPYDHPSPRESRPQDELFYAFTRDAYLSSTTETARQIVNSPGFFRPRLVDVQTQPSIVAQNTRPKFATPKPERDTLRLMTSFTPITQRQMPDQLSPTAPSGPQEDPEPESQSSKAAKTMGLVSKARKKRRPGEMFNVNFSFKAASQRRLSDHTPPISPRSSFSSGSNSSSTSIEESLKKQRIDSTSSDAVTGFPFGMPTPEVSSRGPTTYPSSGLGTAAEAHPGQLVDFASLRHDVHVPVPSPSSEFQLRMGTEEYHDYLSASSRRKSFPTGERATRRVRKEHKILAKLVKADKEANRASPTTTTTNSTSTSMSTRGSGGLRRTISDPCAEAFLAHIRASLEARKSAAARWQDYPVFTDELEKGFLDDEPL
ncbi:hypothetical protein BKA66DRAFT_405625, partial [Pyrenochaeta sp. MPI-SDFR-AT-0127]